MKHNPLPMSSSPISRREALQRTTFGVAGLALAHLFQQDGLLAGDAKKPVIGERRFDLTPKTPPNKPRATAMISLFMEGGPSHIDMFDPKPEMVKHAGKEIPLSVEMGNNSKLTNIVLPPLWEFKQYGQSGMNFSSLIPHMAEIADDICLIRSMKTGVTDHAGATRLFCSNNRLPGHATLGTWLSYGLGNVNQNLPAYVVLPATKGLPFTGPDCWHPGKLPSVYQATLARATSPHIMNLQAPMRLEGLAQKQQLDLINRLNEEYRNEHPGESDVEARIASYELAAGMQFAAGEALDISLETESTREMYGINNPLTRDWGTRCLIARRLVERGVRFVQLFDWMSVWDHHDKIFSELPIQCQSMDQPVAALVKDLKMRGLLDTTLVHWGGEMGRLPTCEGKPEKESAGRDHNGEGFTLWLAGGGVKGGLTYGCTDDFGYKTIENPVTENDFFATILHLFGFDADQLEFMVGTGQMISMIEKDSRVVHEILA